MMDNALPPPRPNGHDFSQEARGNEFSQFSQSSRSVTNSIEVEEHQPRLQQPRFAAQPNHRFDAEEGEEDEEANTQETFTQLTQGNEMTQLGIDDDDDENAGMSQGNECNSPTPIDPLTLPWGRLMPVGGDAANDNAASSPPRPSSARGATEMLPRSPVRAGSIATRSRSPSMGSQSQSPHSNSSSPPRVRFLGLRNLLLGDRFNEYVLGRSAKADVTTQKMEVPATLPTETNPQIQQRNDTRRKRHDFVHAMVSNRHCRVYCLLSNTSSNSGNCDGDSGPPDMEVFVEDTSGNGTLVNGTTLLRRNERRKLHTGDVICLLNPKMLAKKLRSVAERKMYASQYSYVFVNLYEQEARHDWGVSGLGSAGSSNVKGRTGGRVAGDLASPASTTKKGAVNVRAIKCHSINNAKSKRSLFSSSAGGDAAATSNNPHKQQQQLPSSHPNNRTKNSLGSFINNPNSSNTSRRRRVEEEYDLRDILGTGTCGEVRRAIHRRTGEERAVKIISIAGRGGAGPGMSSEKLSAIQAEAEILRKLNHPYVVKLFDMIVAPGKAIYLVMELIRGGDLFDRIVERERYTEVQARRLFRRVLTAVYYLHEDRGIVHRDLKPENILVVDRRSDVNIKLTDFGLAKNMTAEGLKTFCGTPQYFAPEVLRRRHTVKGAGRYGKEIDCWSIGVILFILLSGSPPFDVSAGFDAVASAKVVFYEDQWRSVSREARDLVMRLLEKDPMRRMSVKDACVHPWVLREDGDTHRHPLRDPAVAKALAAQAGRSDSAAENKRNRDSEPCRSIAARPAQNGKESRASDAPSKPPSSPWRKICAPVDANALSPIPAHSKENNQCKFQSKSAPQLSKEGRRSSIWPANKQDKTVTKAIQQSCHTTRPSPDSSPIQKKKLFNQHANIDPVRKKMTKRGVESIKAAGNTLPKPVINEESRLIKKVAAPKKKVQSTLFPSETGKDPKPASELPREEADGSKLNRQTSTVTPPGNEQKNQKGDAVFRLNKKHRVGNKYISPAARAESAAAHETATSPAAEKKAELSEDELQSDFSDADDESPPISAKPPQNSEKKLLQKFLGKRKMESIESSPSIFGGGSGGPLQSMSERALQEGVPRPVSKESCRSKSPPVMEDKKKRCNTSSSSASAARKMVQSHLFGRTPPNDSYASPPADDGPAAEDAQVRLGQAQTEGASLWRQSSGDSASTAGKGKQRSIKSWFQPKK